MSFTIACRECGQKFVGWDEYEAEVKWSQHECSACPDLEDLPLQELRKLAYQEAEEDRRP